MGFVKKLFGKEEPYIPMHQIPGVEPIVVQAVENLFPKSEDQHKIFNALSNRKGNADTLFLLELLSVSRKYYGKDNTEAVMKNVLDTLSSQAKGEAVEYGVMKDCNFMDMKGAVKWVKSITKSQS